MRRREGEREARREVGEGGEREEGEGSTSLLSFPLSVSSVSFASQIGYSITLYTSYDHTKKKVTLMNGSRLSFISTTADQFEAQFRIQYI